MDSSGGGVEEEAAGAVAGYRATVAAKRGDSRGNYPVKVVPVNR
ncbi:hypothetical protein GCM10009555_015620 [Acrocarpospora macrocephala]